MSSHTGSPGSKAVLRRHLMAWRRDLAFADRQSADAQIGRHVELLCKRTRGQRIAAFVAHGGEPDLFSVISRLQATGHQVYLPVVTGKDMHFRRWHPDDEMAPNRFGIPEPVDGEALPAAALEIVFVPLVGFAPDGTRLGMGAGFYDRAFAFQRERVGCLPRLIGAAYSGQEVDFLPADELGRAVARGSLRASASGAMLPRADCGGLCRSRSHPRRAVVSIGGWSTRERPVGESEPSSVGDAAPTYGAMP